MPFTTSAVGRIDLLAPAPLKLVRFRAYSPLPVTALPSMSLFPKSSIRPLGLAHLCRSHPCGSIRPVAKMDTNHSGGRATSDRTDHRRALNGVTHEPLERTRDIGSGD